MLWEKYSEDITCGWVKSSYKWWEASFEIISISNLQHSPFPGSKAKQLNYHTVPILEKHQYKAAVIHVRINDFLKGMPNNITVGSICNDTLEIAMTYYSSWMICFTRDA